MKKHFNLIGNIAHIFIGMNLAYLVCNWANFITFNNHKYIGTIVIAFIFSFGCAFAWEFFQNKAFKIQGNIKDAFITGFGGVIGGLLALNFKDSKFIMTYCAIVSIVAVIGYIYVMYKNKGK
jgi:glycopeptide antibiotics resistance protein